MRSGPMSLGSKIWSRNIFWRNGLCTSVNGLFGGRESECIGGGGIRKSWTCIGLGREQQRSRTERRHNARGKESHRKK